MNKNKKSKIFLLVITLLLLLYGVGALSFTDRFYANTCIDGHKVGLKKVEEVERIIRDSADNYEIKLKTIDNNDQIIKAKDMKLVFDLGSNIKLLKQKQGIFGYIDGFFGTSNLESKPKISLDEKLLKEKLFALPIFDKANRVNPENAKISVVNNEFIVVPEILGNVIKKKQALSAVKAHILDNKTEIDLDKEGLYKKPHIYSDDSSIVKPMETLKRYNASLIKYDIEGAKEEVGPEVISTWVDIDENTNDVSINREKVFEYVKALARKYDTWSLKREFYATGLGMRSVQGGSYGWLIERGAETNQLILDIEEGKKIEREPIYRYKARTRGDNDIGDTYVEIDITRQHLWFYKDNKLVVDTPVVTGKPTKSRYTPLGIYPITYKTKDATLTGQNYSTPVKLWMPFNQNIGIHDASWRSRFGGEIYKTAGSHGCINTPYAAVKQIYEGISKGDPVIVYASGSYVIRADAPKPKKDEEKKDKKDKKNKPQEVEEPEDFGNE